MAITAKQFLHFPVCLMKGDIDLVNDAIKCALFTSSLTYSQANDEYLDAAPYTSNQVAQANGYTTGGVALTTPVVDNASLDATFDADDPEWTVTGAGFAYRFAVYYDDTPAANKPVICIQDFGADVNAVAGTHVIALSEDGLTAITVS